MEAIEWLFAFRFEDMPFVFIALAVAFTVHEFAHAWAAYRFGDETAKREGRLTLNPRKHLDVIGTILIFLVGFGWAKPVPVNRANFKYPRTMGIAVSAAGPLSNLLLVFLSLLAAALLAHAGFRPDSSGLALAVDRLLNIMIYLNAVLFVFNLIPLPPLDGWRILEDAAPPAARIRMQQFAHWGTFVFLLLVFIPPLRKATIQPLFVFAYTDLVPWAGNIVSAIAG